MTALEITYEDGLRLSELTGRLGRLEFMQDHIWTVDIMAFILVAVLTSVLWLIVWWYALMGTRCGDACHVDAGRALPKATLYFRPRVFDTIGGTIYYEWVMTTFCRAWIVVSYVIMIATAIAVAYISIDAGIQADIADVSGQIDAIMAKYGGGA